MAAPATNNVSGNTLVNSLIDGGYYWDDGRNRGSTQIDVFYKGSSLLANVPQTWRWEEKAIRSALDAWEAVADISFQSVAVPRWADISMLVTTPEDDPQLANDTGTTFGYMEGPSATGSNGRSDGAFNYWAAGWNNNGGLKPGGYGYFTILHEIGHGLGLAHPFDAGQSDVAEVFSGLNTLVSIMEYNDYRLGKDGYADAFRGKDWPYAYNKSNPANPSVLDIAAIQHLYGANLDADDGDGDGHADDIYLLPVSNKAKAGWHTIWDTGGVDWIVNPGDGESWIDLRPINFPRDDDPAAIELWSGGGFGQVKDVRAGFIVADDFTGALDTADSFRGVLIENARGGDGSDRIDGNAVANKLVGGGGSDRIAGRGGDDLIKGGKGNDTLIGGAGRDVMTGGKGFDEFIIGRAAHSRSEKGARDRITDFDGHRREDIDLSRIDADPFQDMDQSFEFIGRDQFDGDGAQSAGQVRFKSITEDKLRVEGDRDGDGAADFGIIVIGVMGLQASDFIL